MCACSLPVAILDILLWGALHGPHTDDRGEHHADDERPHGAQCRERVRRRDPQEPRPLRRVRAPPRARVETLFRERRVLRRGHALARHAPRAAPHGDRRAARAQRADRDCAARALPRALRAPDAARRVPHGRRGVLDVALARPHHAQRARRAPRRARAAADAARRVDAHAARHRARARVRHRRERARAPRGAARRGVYCITVVREDAREVCARGAARGVRRGGPAHRRVRGAREEPREGVGRAQRVRRRDAPAERRERARKHGGRGARDRAVRARGDADAPVERGEHRAQPRDRARRHVVRKDGRQDSERVRRRDAGGDLRVAGGRGCCFGGVRERRTAVGRRKGQCRLKKAHLRSRVGVLQAACKHSCCTECVASKGTENNDCYLGHCVVWGGVSQHCQSTGVCFSG